MIDDPLPTDWKALQAGVRRLFNEIGLTASVEVPLRTPRGTVSVDVFAVDENSVDNIQYLVECKNWSEPIPQSVVHAFTTVMHETGANLGFIVSKYGLQSGATRYTESTNILGLTYQELQERYFKAWWQRFFCARVADAAEVVNQYVEPFNSWRGRFLDELPAQEVARFETLQKRYAAFGMGMWLMDVGNLVPKYAHDAPPGIQQYKGKLSEVLGEEFSFKATSFRQLLEEICERLRSIEEEFNAIFGRNIFHRET